MNFVTLVVRSAANSANVASEIRTEVHALDRAVPVQTIGTMGELVGAVSPLVNCQPYFWDYSLHWLSPLPWWAFYGVISYSVAQRTHEIGIRMALGAERSNVLGLIIGQGMIPVLAGLIAGLFIAIGLNRTLSGVLYGISPTDPLTFAVVSLVLIIISLIACAAPARRAIRVDPLMALRHE